MWVSYGYDGAIAGTFLEFHPIRPLPSQLGVQEVTSFDGMTLEQGYDGTLPDGVISVKPLNSLLAEIDKKENGTPSDEWIEFESKLGEFNKKMMFNKVLKRNYEAQRIGCGSCGSIPHVEGCPKSCISGGRKLEQTPFLQALDSRQWEDYSDKSQVCNNDPIKGHVSGLCKSCYEAYKQSLRDGLSVGENK